jgi:diacylglycerol O-acyltransferase
VRTPFELAGRAASAATRPTQTIETTREAIEGVGEIAWATLNPAPDTPLNVEIGPHRRFAFLREELDDFRLVKNAFGGTVNDVVLTVVSGGLQKWLRSRGTRTEGLELRALVPVSIRTHEQKGHLGNQLAVMRGPLPVYVEDPIARLKVVRASMDGLKESKQALGAEVLAGVQNFTPPTVMAQASRLNFSTRLFNLLVTNVPGPQIPLYVLGRELQDIFPLAFLPRNHALAVAIMSYNGSMDFGLLGDYDAMHDLDAFGEMVDDSLKEMVTAAKRRRASNGRAKPRPKRAAKKKPAAKSKAKSAQ